MGKGRSRKGMEERKMKGRRGGTRKKMRRRNRLRTKKRRKKKRAKEPEKMRCFQAFCSQDFPTLNNY